MRLGKTRTQKTTVGATMKKKDQPKEVSLQGPHTAQARRGRNASPLRQIHVGHAPIVLEIAENLSVDAVEPDALAALFVSHFWSSFCLKLSSAITLRNIISTVAQ